ncbi:MAG TPA: cytochrome ubiquinol oxidase subunit I, partial [Streptosporangiaceae bacterium]
RRVHLATIWAAAVGTLFSAYFILAANSWMQHPVGYTIDKATGRARLTDIVAVLTNDVALAAIFHTTAACFLIGGALVTGVSLWRVMRPGPDTAAFRSATKVGAWTTLVSSAALALSGDFIGRVMFAREPMKMAASDWLRDTAAPAGYSLIKFGPVDIRIPDLLSLLATHTLDGRVQGMDQLQAAAVARYGPGSYTPFVPVTYWSYRLMIVVGLATGLIAAIVLWRTRGGRTPKSRSLLGAAVGLPVMPLVASTAGWVFTEMGRQPWLVSGVLRTASGVSPGVSAAEVATSLAVFTVLYAVLAVIEVRLLLRYARGPLPAADPPVPTRDALPAFAY